MTDLKIGGRTFRLSATIGHCRKLKALGVDMLSNTGEAVAAIMTDEEKFVSALYTMIEDQIPPGDEKFTPEAFAFYLDGPTWRKSVDAFRESFSDFFQSRGDSQRDKLILKMFEAGTAASEAIAEQLEALDTQAIRQRIAADLRLNESVGNAIDAALKA